jgi:nucleolar protein 12
VSGDRDSNRQKPNSRQPDGAIYTKRKNTIGGQGDGVSPPLSATTQSSIEEDFTSSDGSRVDKDALSLPSRKRRRIATPDDIEGAYMSRLADHEVKSQNKLPINEHAVFTSDVDTVGLESLVTAAASEIQETEENDQIPKHESLNGLVEADTAEKTDRTVFLGNVSTEAIKSKSARKVLLNHLSSCLAKPKSEQVPLKVESIRFRSTAFASGVGPKRAAYAKKELMEETTHSTNAYVVYTTQAAAKKAAALLNGTVILDRHLRTDLAARPAQIDHRRCVFIGNLSFVDEEMVETDTDNGVKESKRRAKQAADAEEGLWRSFSKVGKIESVRVVRDRSTRVGKGIAYVQFHDENSVEAALLYNDKKFPPLLPRKLRVTRARKPKREIKPSSLSKDGSTHSNPRDGPRSPKGIGRVLSAKADRNNESSKKFVFEGHRATNSAAGKFHAGPKKRKHKAKPTSRSSRRGAAFKAAGSKLGRK